MSVHPEILDPLLSKIQTTTVVFHLILPYIHAHIRNARQMYQELKKKVRNDPGLCQALQNFGGRGKSNNKQFLRLIEDAALLIPISTYDEAAMPYSLSNS